MPEESLKDDDLLELRGVDDSDDPTLEDVTFDVDVHDRAIEQAPYQRANE